MNSKGKENIERICCCGLSIFAGFGVYLATANNLGISKMPALLVGLAITVLILFLYRFLLMKAAAYKTVRVLDFLTMIAVLLIVSLNYSGLISLWKELTVNDRPFIFYALIAVVLLGVAAWRGKRAVLRSGPIICAVFVFAVFFDTLFIIPKAEPSLLFGGTLQPAAQIFQGGAKIALALIGPGLIFLFCLYPQKTSGEKAFSWKDLAKGLILPFAYLLVELLRDLLLFGQLIALDNYPILRALKSVDFGVGVSRIEFLGIMALSSGILIGIMLEFTILVKIMDGIFKINKKLSIAIQIVLVLALSICFYYFGSGIIWIVAAAAAVLLLFAYPLSLIIKG